MRRLFTGVCSPESIFEIRDPSAITESEFESWVVKGLICMFPNYHCVVFTGGFRHEGALHRPDLALVANDFSHWFIIEVELTSHSLTEHVLPQVRSFRYGEPDSGCARALAVSLGIGESQARTLLECVPYGVAVILNRDNSEWEVALRAHDIQVLTVSSYASSSGTEAIEVNGRLEVVFESLGFGQYIASVRSIRFGVPIQRLPEGRVQMRDLLGNTAWWRVIRERGDTWISRESGTPEIPDQRTVQLIATGDGYLSLR
jgi:hypothetical protein